MTRTIRLLAMLLAVAVVAPAAAETHDLIPADAMGGIACRSISGLVKKTEQLIKDLGVKVPDDAQPSKLCKQVFDFLGISKGLDTKRGCSAVVVNKKTVGGELGFGNLDRYIVISIPFSDLDEMADNFGFGKGKLKPGKVEPIAGQRTFGKLCYVRDGYILMGNDEKAILSVAKGKTIGSELSEARRKSIAEGDCLCHLGTEVWGDMYKEIVRNSENILDRVKKDEDKKTAKELLESLTSVRHVLCTCRIDGGIGFGCMCVFPKETPEAVKKFLTALRAGDDGSTLKGLPEGNVVAALAAKGDGSKNGHIFRVLIDLLLRDVLEEFKIFGSADRPALHAVFQEVWQRLQGSRFAIYKTDDERKLGLFNVVGILDVEDAERFVGQLKLLAKLGHGDGLDFSTEAGKEKTEAEIKQLIEDLGARRFQTRESATSKLLLAGEPVLPFLETALKSKDLETSKRAERIKREIVQAAEERRKELLSGNLARAVKPSFKFLDKTEKMEGFEVMQIGVKLKKDDAAVAPQLRALFGPDWARVRMAVHGKQVVVLVGSDVKLMTAALGNLKDNKGGLASAKVLSEQAKQIDGGRKIELHVATAMVHALATAEDLEKPTKVQANPPLTSLGFSIDLDRIQCECWLPLAELKMIVKAGGW